MRWSYGDEGANQQSNIIAIDINAVKSRMLQVRGQQVLLDRDVAALYGVETRIVNQAVKNNPEKFPAGYVAELTAQEVEVLRSKILTLEAKPGKGHYSKHGYKVFTERGLYMLATILKGERAVRASVLVPSRRGSRKTSMRRIDAPEIGQPYGKEAAAYLPP